MTTLRATRPGFVLQTTARVAEPEEPVRPTKSDLRVMLGILFAADCFGLWVLYHIWHDIQALLGKVGLL